jgi:hypothetical protein
MAQANNTYRQQSSGSLGTLTNCLSCGTYTNYAVQYCSGGGTIYVDSVNAFDGQTPILSSTSYSVGDVVWITPSQGGARYCATVTAVNQDDPSTQFFDEAAGPWSQCNQCIVP